MDSFAALYDNMEASPKYQAEKLSVGFLSDVHQYMSEHGVSKAELARRAGCSPAYITKLFNGSTNISVETMAKLAVALNCQIHFHLACKDARVRWFDVHQSQRKSHWADAGRFVEIMQGVEAINQDGWNDEKFALAA